MGSLVLRQESLIQSYSGHYYSLVERRNSRRFLIVIAAAILVLFSAFLLNSLCCNKNVVFIDEDLPFRPSIYVHLTAAKPYNYYYLLRNSEYQGNESSARLFARKRDVAPESKPEPQDGEALLQFRASGCPPIDRWGWSPMSQDVDFAEFDDIRIPQIVHYIWLRQETFTFRNYLSVLSVVRFLQPLKIVFHISERPKPDAFRYHQWWEEMLASIPHVVVRETSVKQETELGKQVLESEGGFIVPNDVIFMKTFHYSGAKPIEIDAKKSNEVIASTFPFAFISVAECLTLRWQETVLRNATISVSCIELPFEVYPHEFWQSDDELGELVRFLFYGSVKPLQPRIDEGSKIPAICHYVWIGGVEMDLVAYLSILSCLHLGKADAVLIHGNMEPTGFRWKRLVDSNRKVKFIRHEVPESVYGNAAGNLAHVSDVWRVDLLLKYGGVYLDWDALILRPFDSLDKYDALANYDITDEWKPFPFAFNLGVFAAKKNAPYLKFLKESMRYFVDENNKYSFIFRYNPCLIPYKVYECYPDTLKVDRHLQVICFKGKCHPTWKDDFARRDRGHHIDWQNGEAFAIHWTYPNPKELQTEHALQHAIKRNLSAMAVGIACRILEAANIDIDSL